MKQLTLCSFRATGFPFTRHTKLSRNTRYDQLGFFVAYALKTIISKRVSSGLSFTDHI